MELIRVEIVTVYCVLGIIDYMYLSSTSCLDYVAIKLVVSQVGAK